MSVPSSYDLASLVLLSPTEGEDKPLKYPTIFNGANAAIITRTDLAAAAEFDLEPTCRNIQSVCPGMKIFEVSSKTRAGEKSFSRS